jgi:hypothetical protein
MPPSAQQLAQELNQAVVKLYQLLASEHGFYKGSQLSSLAEAQGGQIVSSKGGQGATFDHLGRVRTALRVLAERENTLQSLLGKVGELNRGEMIAAREKLRPLLDYVRQCRETLTQTVEMAEQLMRDHQYRQRLAAVGFGQGGLGPETGRGPASLVSNQLRQFVARGLPVGSGSNLLPSGFTQSVRYLQAVEELPADEKEALFKVAKIMTLIRGSLLLASVRASASQATNFLKTFAGMLGNAFSAAGTLLDVPILIMPDPRKLLENKVDA